jgi:hypothetical protein
MYVGGKGKGLGNEEDEVTGNARVLNMQQRIRTREDGNWGDEAIIMALRENF